MNFSFGIITTTGRDVFVNEIIDSIKHQNIPNYEIIVVGGGNYKDKITTFIPFEDENKKTGRITKKKNLITKNSQYENIVYLHDYIYFYEGWYEGFVKFNLNHQDWQIAMNKIYNIDGTRYRDWCSWDDPRWGESWICDSSWCGPNGLQFNGQPRLVPYTYSKYHNMYISGAYWVAKKYVMKETPLNEEIKQNSSEDVEWSLKVRNKYKYRMNTFSSVGLLEFKHVVAEEVFDD